jgi:hypothetical protein
MMRQAHTATLVKVGTCLLAVPTDELIQAEIVDPPRNRGRDAVQPKRLETTPFRPLVYYQDSATMRYEGCGGRCGLLRCAPLM